MDLQRASGRRPAPSYRGRVDPARDQYSWSGGRPRDDPPVDADGRSRLAAGPDQLWCALGGADVESTGGGGTVSTPGNELSGEKTLSGENPLSSDPESTPPPGLSTPGTHVSVGNCSTAPSAPRISFDSRREDRISRFVVHWPVPMSDTTHPISSPMTVARNTHPPLPFFPFPPGHRNDAVQV